MEKSVTQICGILTSGGDAPGLNAAIRGVARTAMDVYGIKVIGIENGYRGLIEDDSRVLEPWEFSGILARGGTILGTSREKPFKDKNWQNDENGPGAVELIKKTYKKLNLDCLVVLGGNGTNTTGYLLSQEGLNIIGLPKTIDNDIAETDITFGFHTALTVATEAIDRLHSTASSHNRVMVIEVMGHKAGWLSLYSGVAGGGDVVLIPEIPYDIKKIAHHLEERVRSGKTFSIVVVAEGALSMEEAGLDKKAFKKARAEMSGSIGYRVAREIEEATGQEARVTVLGYLQRGGTPVAYDRVLASQFGTAAATMLAQGDYGKMVALQDNNIVGVPLELIAHRIKRVPLDHRMIATARAVGTCMGD
ncbi:6-phosphofructokinase [Brucepastera parasyntrophica]|uniref:6-phosphofructokinase n=1 Tax=Brucepastera parasyntrophica TaxID=2880008 RepID=UPI0021094343|nr:ATP-dependent 6-phosphofructokinase [Brucepastera parasyntrophica]ULQ59019.1 6-phosphofructokinase [Brucepastera parasyntrophica]